MKKLTAELIHDEPKMKDGKTTEQIREEDIFVVSSHQDLTFNHIVNLIFLIY
jgi:hypothetical protein